MSNTQLRIISALVLAIIVGICITIGTASSLGLIGTIGILVVDEVIDVVVLVVGSGVLSVFA